MLEEFGFKRVNWVLANTIQEKSGDGRFRPDNRSWAQRTFIPEDMGHKVEFIVNSHSEVVNGFVNQVREPIRSLTSSAQNTANPIHGGFRLHRKGAGTESGHSERILLDTGKSALVCP